MTINEGEHLPDVSLFRIGGEPEDTIRLRERAAGRTVLIFGVPGAFTGTCSNVHVPDVLTHADDIRARGVDEIICLAVNDPFVLDAWAKSTGLTESSITLVGDCDGSFVRATGLAFDAPAVGLAGRSKRFLMLAKDGIVSTIKVEDSPGECTITRGSAALDWL